MITLSQKVQELINLYNANSKLNKFLYNNKDCNELLKSIIGNDRWQFVVKSNQIERDLIPLITPLHGKKVKILCPHSGTVNEGIIEHLPTRQYKDYNGVLKTTDNTVSFRRNHENSSNYDANETIALWVNTGDKYSTHLYSIDDLELID